MCVRARACVCVCVCVSVCAVLNVMLPVLTYTVWSHCGCEEPLLTLLLDHFGCSSSDLQHYSKLHHLTRHITNIIHYTIPVCYSPLHHRQHHIISYATSCYITLHHISHHITSYPALPQSSPWRCADSVPTH